MTAVPNSWLRLQSPNHKDDQVTDGNITDHNVVVTPDNRGLAYADGFFTTMGVIDGLILWQDYHGQRLISHGRALQLNIDSQALLLSLQSHAQQLEQGMLKLIITRASQDTRGYSFAPSVSGSACEIWLQSSTMLINTTEQTHLPDGRMVLRQPAGAAVCLTSQLACLPPPLAGLKSLNRLDSVLASGELQALKVAQLVSNLGEGLVRDMTGNWVEGTMSNVFYQLADEQQVSLILSNSHDTTADYLLNGQWFTPPLTQSGVTGVMRQVIIDGFAKTSNPVQIRVLNDDDLPHLSRLFFCNALRGIMPMTALTLLAGDKISLSL